jgi:hypothetical protein
MAPITCSRKAAMTRASSGVQFSGIGCGAETSCDAATEHLAACGITDLQTAKCTSAEAEAAEKLLTMSCDEIATRQAWGFGEVLDEVRDFWEHDLSWPEKFLYVTGGGWSCGVGLVALLSCL